MGAGLSEVGSPRGLEKDPLMDSVWLPRVQGSSPKLAHPISEVWTLRSAPHLQAIPAFCLLN